MPAPEPEWAGFLEPEQLGAHLRRPVARAHLDQTTRAALWGLRILVLAVSAMVVYTFIAQLA
jgi:hypothetical protein